MWKESIMVFVETPGI